MRLAFSYLRHHLGLYLVALLFLVVEALCDLAQPSLMALVVDHGVQTRDVGTILSYGIAMVGVALGGALAAVVRNNVANRVAQTVGYEMRGDLYRAVQALSAENIDRLQTASVITRMTNDVTTVVNFVNSTMRIAVKMPITCIGAVALIIYQTPCFAPVLLVVVAAVVVLVVLNMRLSSPRYRGLQRAMDRLNGVSREFLSSVRTVKAFGAQEQERTRFTGAATATAQAGIHAMALPSVLSPLVTLAVNLGIVVLLWLSRAQNADEIGRLMASLNYMTQLVQSLGMLNMVVNSAARCNVSSARIEEVLREQPAQSWRPLGDKPAQILGAVAFRDVSFTYAGSSRPALEQVSFELDPGQTLGIIGPTGSGKTTLADLVARLYDATEGTVLLDGRDIRSIPVEELRKGVSLVPQASTLFAGTVAENLRWGDEDASMAQLREACRIAQADEFVERLSHGYDSVLGQGGVNLSGGQRQRLCLARALVRRPRVLVLDDCTSALDGSTERAVLEGLRTHLTRTTVLLVSQRIATVRGADFVLCLENGRVSGLGTHNELLRSCDAYRAIVSSQLGSDALPPKAADLDSQEREARHG